MGKSQHTNAVIDSETLVEDAMQKEIGATEAKPSTVAVFDVAAYILQETGPLATMKLQKLVYYCQAWSLAWDKHPLFTEPIEAWVNGPVIRKLLDFHRGRYELDAIPIGNPELLTAEQRDTIDTVLEYYGRKSAECLIEMTQWEDPWRNARKGIPPLESGNVVIALEDIAEYYSSLPIDTVGAPHPDTARSHKIPVPPPGFALQSNATVAAMEKMFQTFGIAGDRKLMPLSELRASMIRNGIRPEDNEFSRAIIEERER